VRLITNEPLPPYARSPDPIATRSGHPDKPPIHPARTRPTLPSSFCRRASLSLFPSRDSMPHKNACYPGLHSPGRRASVPREPKPASARLANIRTPHRPPVSPFQGRSGPRLTVFFEKFLEGHRLPVGVRFVSFGGTLKRETTFCQETPVRGRASKGDVVIPL